MRPLAIALISLFAFAPPSAATPCEVTLSTKIDPLGGGRYRVRALATNLTARALVVSGPDRCPNGPVAFTGLYPGYDYYRSCMKGACVGPRAPLSWTLPPGKPVTLATVEINANGAQCTRRLAAGRHEIGFTMPFAVSVCTSRASFVQDRARARFKCPPVPACGLACDGGFARDPNGCMLCACEKNPLR